MAWNTPLLWVSGAVTSTLMNAQIYQNFKAIGDPWTAYTPVWSSTGTQPTLGNGTMTGSYRQAGKAVEGSLILTIGSTTNLGTGNYRWSLPTSPLAEATPLGFQVSPTRAVMGRLITANTFNLYTCDTGVILSNSSTSIAVGTIIQVHFSYESS